ncbi:MAG: cystathionine beta-lyase [Alphaproteobacteria bacterium]|nr:cystathionine beta-lyase [Alphaproteobacteria bacterium]MDE2042580.1 cystathionine beta-lyase [Alphaproteobacteria bacterium]MDE2340906.1 cystathionine beta-lyase [Alphaproteobacteria bacterium]
MSKPSTTLISAGRRAEWTQGIVNPAVWRASTTLYENCAALEEGRKHNADGQLFYGRRGTPTHWALAEALTALEPGAAGTMLFPSGLAAVMGALLAVLRPGDHLLMVDSVYDPTRRLCDQLLRSIGVETTYYDPMIGAEIATLIKPNTRAIFLESPGSLTFEVQDIPAIVAVARGHNIITLIDNTWATPLYLPALSLGVDISILACTKYICGHSDVMLGSVTSNAATHSRVRLMAQQLGQTTSPDDAALVLRGLRTLDVRLARHQENGLKVARWLAEQPQVARVIHPALRDCPGHAHWARDFRGASGLFSYVLKGGDKMARAALIDGLTHFGIGYSWGGFESLALPIDPEHFRSATHWQAEGPAVRLHIGLEDADDLIADLAAGLACYPAR